MYAAEMEAPLHDPHHTAAASANNAVTAVDDLDDPAPNLEVIYQAFGEHSDLYKDVLQVKSSATAEQIQMAYFDRRSELFALLASIDSEEEQDDITASHRFHAERKMDAVVMAVRILGDVQLREEYDNVMVLKEVKSSSKKSSKNKHHHHPKEPPSSSGASRSSSTREPDGVYAGMSPSNSGPQQQRRPISSRSPKRKSPKRRSSRHYNNNNTTSHATSMDSMDQQDLDQAKSRSTSMDDPIVLYSDLPTAHHHHHHGSDPVYDFVAPSHSRGSSSKGGGMHHKKHGKESSFEASTLNATRDDEDTLPPYLEHNNNIHHDDILDPGDDTTLDDTKITWDDQATLQSEFDDDDDTWTKESVSNNRLTTRRNSSSALSAVTNVGFVSRIQEEVAGTVEDTLVSFEQVLNVFTLQERDIQAVMGRIDKAKRQLQKRS